MFEFDKFCLWIILKVICLFIDDFAQDWVDFVVNLFVNKFIYVVYNFDYEEKNGWYFDGDLVKLRFKMCFFIWALKSVGIK